MGRQIHRKNKLEIDEIMSYYDHETSEMYLKRIKKNKRTADDEMREIFGSEW